MARRKQKGASFGKQKGSHSQQVQQNRGRQQTITYFGIGLASLLGLCLITWLVFRSPTPAANDALTDTLGDTELADDDTEAEADSGDEGAAASEDDMSGSDDHSADMDMDDFTLLEADRTMADKAPAERANAYSDVPEMIIDTANTYDAVLTTANGEMRIRLFDDEAPLTVNNFVSLAQDGFYDGTVFHRVMVDFMAQGGDPTGTGTSGPGYQFADEVDNDLEFDRRGLLAMANSGPATNGSQFFITFQETPWLTGNHTIFGELLEGDDVLGAITITGGGVNPDVLERIDIYVSEG